MRDIKRKKYEKIVKLLKSDNKEDIFLGIDYLRQQKFTDEELKWNFPARDIIGRNFRRSGKIESNIHYVTTIGNTDVYINYMWVFAIDSKPAEFMGYEEI